MGRFRNMKKYVKVKKLKSYSGWSLESEEVIGCEIFFLIFWLFWSRGSKRGYRDFWMRLL